MSQDKIIDFTKRGINSLEIGNNVTLCMKLKPFSMHPEKENFIFNQQTFNFYFLDSGWDYRLQNGNKIQNVFFTVDTQNIIQAITVFLSDNTNKFCNDLDSIFGNKSLKATTGIGEVDTGTKYLWVTNYGINVFLSELYINSKKSIIQVQIYSNKYSAADLDIYLISN